MVFGVVGNAAGEGLATGTAAQLATGLASGLSDGFEFRFNELGFGLELAKRVGAVLRLDLESMFVPSFETNCELGFIPKFPLNLESGFEAVAAVAD